MTEVGAGAGSGVCVGGEVDDGPLFGARRDEGVLMSGHQLDDGGRTAGEARRRLGERQGAVVAALVGGGEVPEGLDAGRLRVQARSLVAKRRSVVARLRPEVAAAAGEDLAVLFAAYAAERAEPPSGYRADADDFAEWLRRQGRLPAARRRPWWSRLLRR